MPEESTVEEVVDFLVRFMAEYGLSVLGALITLIVGYIIANFARKLLNRAMARTKVDPVLQPWPGAIAKLVIIVVTIIAVLDRFGVETTSMIAVVGAAGLAIGLALQGTLSNVASGVMLLIFRPFGVGDAVNIDGEVVIISEIGLFMTFANLPDGPRVIIPNSRVWGNKVVNLSITVEDRRRINEVFCISYADDMGKAIEVLKQMCEEEERVLKDPPPLVAVTKLNDSSVDLVFWAWTKRADWWPTRLDLIKRGKERLEAAGITIPFPQRDVHLFNEKTG
ncbi:MAG: hypothetical protein EA425_05100 [Puniceicoccaceae bacterium]|nr:MAG: hypothetical protein EA425_05100 [Puniceicoccaceae bacterium]